MLAGPHTGRSKAWRAEGATFLRFRAHARRRAFREQNGKRRRNAWFKTYRAVTFSRWAALPDRALHGSEPGAPLPDDVAALSGCKLNELIARETGVDDIPHGLAELDALPIRFDEVIDGGTNDIEAAALRFLEHLDD